jgi:hypothetical protein
VASLVSASAGSVMPKVKGATALPPVVPATLHVPKLMPVAASVYFVAA